MIVVLLLRVEPDIEVDAATERLAALTAGLVAMASAAGTLALLPG